MASIACVVSGDAWDIGMPLLNGLEATRQIVRHAPSVRVLILSMHSDQAYVTQAM